MSERIKRIKRDVPEKDLEPGRIPRWYVRYSPSFCLQAHTDEQLEDLRKDWEKRFKRKAKLAVSDMGEVVIIFSPDSLHKK